MAKTLGTGSEDARILAEAVKDEIEDDYGFRPNNGQILTAALHYYAAKLSIDVPELKSRNFLVEHSSGDNIDKSDTHE